jgi:hypothetical protein
MKNEQCPICGRPARNVIATYCQFGCGKLVSRARSVKDPSERNERVEAVKRAWQEGVFKCYYTGGELDIVDSSSPFYLTFDHVTPRVGKKIVGCAAYINDVKSDCTEQEFKHNILVLAEHFKSGRSLRRSDFKLNHYKRHRQSVKE